MYPTTNPDRERGSTGRTPARQTPQEPSVCAASRQRSSLSRALPNTAWRRVGRLAFAVRCFTAEVHRQQILSKRLENRLGVGIGDVRQTCTVLRGKRSRNNARESCREQTDPARLHDGLNVAYGRRRT